MFPIASSSTLTIPADKQYQDADDDDDDDAQSQEDIIKAYEKWKQRGSRNPRLINNGAKRNSKII